MRHFSRRVAGSADAARPRAFTLIELLVVLVVVAVLAAILLPTFGLVGESARATKCLSNMRQIGLAILAYQHDHNTSFPGPLEKGQTAYYTSNDTKSIAVVLAPYLGLSPSTTSQFAPLLMCPSFALKSSPSVQTPGGNKGHAYVVQNNWTDSDGQRIWPFGKTGTAPLDPMRATLLNINLTTTWAVTELDHSWFPTSPGNWTSELPDKPVHGAYRNAIFFDFHAGRVSGTDNTPL